MSTPSFAAALIMASRFGMLICRFGWISSTTRRRYAAASQSPYTSAGPLGSIFSDGADGGRTVLHFQLRKEKEKLNPEQRATRILSRLQKDFRLSELPVHIECFDNSNIQGTNPVASCVVFKMAKPSIFV